jgi:antitoxin component HigA of HigAB toxin-antitoxin module
MFTKAAFLFAAVIFISPLAAQGAIEEIPVEPQVESQSAEDQAFEDAKPQLREQLMQQKQDDVLMEHVADLRSEADVRFDLKAYAQDDPEAVIAEVDGIAITKTSVQQFEQQQLESIGMPAESAEAKQLVNTLLIQQKAESEGLKATQQQIDQEFSMYAEHFGGEQMLEQQLAMMGFTSEDLKNEIAQQLPIQLYINAYIEEHFDPEQVEITEEELREYYEMINQMQ